MLKNGRIGQMSRWLSDFSMSKIMKSKSSSTFVSDYLMIRYVFNQIRARKERKQFKDFGFKIVDFLLSKDGKIQYAQWLHPAEFRNHPGNAGNVVTQETVDFYSQLVKQGDTVIDIGAHEGDTTVPMALAVGKSMGSASLQTNP